jgi:hypothetical protein
MSHSPSVPEPPGCPAPQHGWARLVRRLHTIRRRRLLQDLQRRAEWAGKVHQTPTVHDWTDDIGGTAR